jgi:hypothetical protein
VATFAIIDASAMLFLDQGADVDRADVASLQMDTAPTQASDTPTATTTVSMFQTNSAAFRGTWRVSWEKIRTDAAAYLSAVAW